MNFKSTIRIGALICLSLLFPSLLSAQQIIRPTNSKAFSFAIVIDELSYQHCKPAVDAYRAQLEKEGLPTYILSHKWTSPEEVKGQLLNLSKCDGLEGVVFIGEIPIAMVTRAQHLTSAFKMNEKAYPLRTVSVPSDRFYDDFNLIFRPIKDSTCGNMFFYELAPESPQYIECDIYSGRIKALKDGTDPYQQITDYLTKVVEQHRQTNPLDQFVSYTGDGSYSNSLIAWRAEQQLLNEQFPGVFTKTRNAKFLRFSMEPFMKDEVIKELRRDDLDFMVFHEHGMPSRQYLTGDAASKDSDEGIASLKSYLRSIARRHADDSDKYAYINELIKPYGFDSTWYAGSFDPKVIAADSLEDLRSGIILEDIPGIAPNARFVIFDACYNGDFRENECIASRYILSKGKCVATFANSVNVLQDKAAFELLGLLGEGLSIGAWAKYNQILESHVIGDPTFRFTSPKSEEICAIERVNSSAFCKQKLEQQQDIDLQNLALEKLYRLFGSKASDLIFAKYQDSPYAIVRYTALKLLERIGGDSYYQALKMGITDNFEFIRRISAHRMGICGAEEFIPYLVDSYMNDKMAARVVFNISQSITCFDQAKVQQVIEAKFGPQGMYAGQDESKAALLKMVKRNAAQEALTEVASSTTSANHKIDRINFLRNVPYHQIVDELLVELKNPNQPEEVRVALAESFAWFVSSVHKAKIVAVCEDLLQQESISPVFRDELTRACSRLKSVK